MCYYYAIDYHMYMYTHMLMDVWLLWLITGFGISDFSL